MNVKKYLNRIEITEKDLRADLETLKMLQKQHLLTIPFENLDIHWRRLIVLDTAKFYEKIINEKRGGFCYELNGLFNELLAEIGFQTKIVSARVSKGAELGAEYDHLAILTKIDDEEYLTDVGFGDFSAEPLKFVLDIEQQDANGTFLIKKYDSEYYEVLKKHSENWQSEYIFKDSARDLQEFTEMCIFHQTSPESHFTRGRVCSLMTENGRKTLTDDRFIEMKNGVKSETEIASEAEFDEILRREFQINRSET